MILYKTIEEHLTSLLNFTCELMHNVLTYEIIDEGYTTKVKVMFTDQNFINNYTFIESIITGGNFTIVQPFYQFENKWVGEIGCNETLIEFLKNKNNN